MIENYKVFNVHGQKIEARTFEEAYSIRFECSVAQAIADRDEPMSEADLVTLFRESTGHGPTDAEIQIMRPNTPEQIQEQIDYYRE